MPPKTLNKIKAAYTNNQFANYIEYIRFPNYKNLFADSKIEFNFPLTVLTGLNGSGKSSALHAIYGCPEGKSTTDFWFTTNVDPISDSTEKPNCYIYAYRDENGNLLEVIKKRSGTAKGADYWETARPEKKYRMALLRGGGRNPPLPKNVIYLDFRAQLSAFDQFFYFGKFYSSTTMKSKQDKLRKSSKFLRYAIDTDRIYRHYTMSNSIPISLSEEEVSIISEILDKPYSSCKVINHNFYGQDGVTIYFNTAHLNYSEAYAGRGEFAVVKLIHELHKAPDNSLVILDEPEVSLHPGAQKELKDYLLKICLKKKLQIIISTHSPTFVEGLPDEAIKLFYQDISGKFNIKNTCNYREAFENIGVTIKDSDKKIIYVEDKTAKAILDGVIDSLGNDLKLLFNVRHFPGGADDVLKAAVAYSQENENHKYILLDGDKKQEKLSLTSVSTGDRDSLDFWKDAVNAITGIQANKLPFRFDSGTADAIKREAFFNYYEFLTTNLHYFPGQIPEDVIWNEDFANSLLNTIGVESSEFSGDSKENILTFSKLFYGVNNDANYNSTIQLFLNNSIKEQGEYIGIIISILEKLRELSEG